MTQVNLKQAEKLYAMHLKRLPLLFAISFIYILLSSSLSYASPVMKLKRGIVNVLTSPGEIGKYALKTTLEAEPDYLGPVYGVFYGMPKGFGYGAVRFISGFIDFFTFYWEKPANWEPLIPVEPFTFKETSLE
ncbi:MAG: hypothetical protein COV74_00065 [Candidatus Omnitrophica bacterium CG11_big_fil_rev_8_21_14_0_20_45_26]|uniref:Exosortase system-associated protein, TIGR04073 family n=1 Tax=Candidatus Abzuiibacterium crystallinum TaxID=1974748 RepID=A0A2H0LV68_9BACT|nr:MAG: hypothetical protein COV74_00065 [Candidatus Omnitrophica bacterium CG11_big_fil_rev_8_21_14_0_20_45_26]